MGPCECVGGSLCVILVYGGPFLGETLCGQFCVGSFHRDLWEGFCVCVGTLVGGSFGYLWGCPYVGISVRIPVGGSCVCGSLCARTQACLCWDGSGRPVSVSGWEEATFLLLQTVL